jgi:FMN phosphatase YigB (HAD superfamily)
MNQEPNLMNSIPIYVYVDVDDTFVRSASSKRIPMPAAIQHVRTLKEQGAILYCWSSGGANYAERSAAEFGIADCFEAFYPGQTYCWTICK